MSNELFNKVTARVEDFKPHRGYILVERCESEKVVNGIIRVNEETMMRAKVITLGLPMLTVTGDEIPMNVKVGDTVLMEMYQITEVIFNGVKYILTKEETISCVFEEDEPSKL